MGKELFFKWEKEDRQLKDLKILLLEQEVRGLKAMLSQYKRDYKKLLEEKV